VRNTTAASTKRRATYNEIYVTWVERIEDAGNGNVRVVFAKIQDVGGNPVRVECEDALIMPRASIPDGIGKAIVAIGRVLIATDGSISVSTH
jgi:hypothetical protein